MPNHRGGHPVFISLHTIVDISPPVSFVPDLLNDLMPNRYPLGVDASELESDGEKLASVAKLARERMAAEMKDIAERREERKCYR